MSNSLLDFVVKFSQVTSTASASLGFLHNLGVVAKYKAPETPASVVITTADATDVIPAVLTLAGDFVQNDEFTITLTKTDPSEFKYSIQASGNAAAAAQEITTALNADPLVSATANGETVEVLSIDSLTVTLSDAKIESPIIPPQIVEVTDPDTLKNYTDAYDDIQGAFDAGLNKVYLILVDDPNDIADTIKDKESEFYTAYITSQFTPEEIIAGLSAWTAVRGASGKVQDTLKQYSGEADTCVFFEDTTANVRDYGALYAFGALLSASTWRNQQYIPTNAANVHAITDTGAAESLFDDRISFYFKDEEQGTRLGFFVAGGKSITTPYINKEIQLVMQSEMLSLIRSTQPNNIERNRRLLEQRGGRVLTRYAENELLNPDGENSISISSSSEAFIVNGKMTTTEAEALWRVKIDAMSVMA